MHKQTTLDLQFQQYASNVTHLQMFLNQTIHLLESNQQTFNEKLANLEENETNLFLHGESEKIAESIADLKRIRDKLGRIEWCL